MSGLVVYSNFTLSGWLLMSLLLSDNGRINATGKWSDTSSIMIFVVGVGVIKLLRNISKVEAVCSVILVGK